MSFPARLKEERKRLRLTQTDIAMIAGTSKNSQLNYEKGNVVPGATYLEAVAKAGVDIQYVLTGERGGVVLAKEEKELLELYRRASLPSRVAAFAALGAGGTSGSGAVVEVNGDVSGGTVAITIKR